MFRRERHGVEDKAISPVDDPLEQARAEVARQDAAAQRTWVS
jgi:hypothetical protein